VHPDHPQVGLRGAVAGEAEEADLARLPRLEGRPHPPALGVEDALGVVGVLDRVELQEVESSRNREVLAEGTAVVWAADAPDGGTYVALFNRGEKAARVEAPLRTLGLAGAFDVRDLWARAARGDAISTVSAEVEPHGAALLRLSRRK
jgi:hypothetical protein